MFAAGRGQRENFRGSRPTSETAAQESERQQRFRSPERQRPKPWPIPKRSTARSHRPRLLQRGGGHPRSSEEAEGEEERTTAAPVVQTLLFLPLYKATMASECRSTEQVLKRWRRGEERCHLWIPSETASKQSVFPGLARKKCSELN